MFGLTPSTPRQVEQLQKFDDTKVVIVYTIFHTDI